jgi:hypothetical protein
MNTLVIPSSHQQGSTLQTSPEFRPKEFSAWFEIHVTALQFLYYLIFNVCFFVLIESTEQRISNSFAIFAAFLQALTNPRDDGKVIVVIKG